MGSIQVDLLTFCEADLIQSGFGHLIQKILALNIELEDILKEKNYDVVHYSERQDRHDAHGEVRGAAAAEGVVLGASPIRCGITAGCQAPRPEHSGLLLFLDIGPIHRVDHLQVVELEDERVRDGQD